MGTTKQIDGKVAERGKKRATAMAHPIRAQALRLLVERGELSPKEIAEVVGENVQNVSYHLRQLVKLDCAELVREEKVEKKGAIQHFYIATERHLIDTDDWDALEPMVGEAILDEILQRILDDFVLSRKSGIIGSDSSFHLSRTPLVLDEEGVREAMANSERWREEQSEIERRSAERMAESEERGIPTSSSLAFYKMPRRVP